MNLSLHLRIVGLLLLALATAHFFFPKRFGWKEDLGKLTLLNRQIFLVHDFFIMLMLYLFGTLSFFFAPLLLERSPLARVVLIGMILFWLLRLAAQLFYYDRALWTGNRFNTVAHLLFTVMWSYFVLVYVLALRSQLTP